VDAGRVEKMLDGYAAFPLVESRGGQVV
jgi:hypothetical protein